MVQGSTYKQMRTAVKRLGKKLYITRRTDMDTDTGIINVRSALWPHDHLVVLKDGMIFDTDATVWDFDVFASACSATFHEQASMSQEG